MYGNYIEQNQTHKPFELRGLEVNLYSHTFFNPLTGRQVLPDCIIINV